MKILTIFTLITSVFGSGNFTSKNHRLYYNDNEFRLKGLNYFGFESYCRVVQGLWVHDLDFYIDFIKFNNFNTIRLPFSYEMAINIDDFPEPNCMLAMPDKNQTIRTMLHSFFEKCLERDLFILLDFHTINTYVTEHPYGNIHQDEFYYAWDIIIDDFVDYPNLLGLDIKNEPHGTTTWDEWGLIVNKFIQHVSTKYPQFKGVYFVEGIQDNACWGGSFTGIKDTLYITDKIVFSPHTYGVSVLGDIAIGYGETQFYELYGFLKDIYNNTIIIGEAGGFYTGEDLAWHHRYSHYLKKIEQRSSFYWCLNPNSADTRGVLNDDWTTPNNDKLLFLEDLQPNPSKVIIPKTAV